MMRYQRVSPDVLPLANGRKPTPRTCKDEEADNGRLSFTANGGAFDGKSLRYRPGASPSSTAGQDQNFPPSDSPQSDNHHHHHHQHPTRTAHDGGGAAILQWGQNKRSRGSRTERAATAAGVDESSYPARQVIKIHRQAATAVGGDQKPSSMAPPCGAAPYSRGTNLRPAMTVRDHHHSGSLLNRSASDDHRSAVASPSRAHNGSGPRAHPHRITAGEKRPPALPDNHHHHHATAGGRTGGGGCNQLETKSSAETEKVSLEAFEWPRIYLSLSRKEKEDDFLAMKGTKLPQRPKKRAKNVDKTLQYCFPGMWLSDLTRGRYEVREKKCVKKRRRGLKGMESMESESE